MGTSEIIFVDSNYFVSLFNPEDTRHQHALEISDGLEEAETHLYISNFVFAEIVTVLSQRKSREAGIKAGMYLLSRHNIQMTHVDENVQAESWRIFQETQSKNVSFVDCSIIATMRADGFQKLLTFDTTDFKKLQNRYRFSFYE